MFDGRTGAVETEAEAETEAETEAAVEGPELELAWRIWVDEVLGVPLVY